MRTRRPGSWRWSAGAPERERQRALLANREVHAQHLATIPADLERAAAGSQQPQHRRVVVQHVPVKYPQAPPRRFPQEVPQQQSAEPCVLVGVFHEQRKFGAFGTVGVKPADCHNRTVS